ncbi:transmembrane protein, putative [Medicago truncatula]|uniref:Transmembrane protein, putative n=1 Tax=Medicago truncatula TaxID=3880 RepID=G7K4Z7_MEDTR|nr:transmembrane protein, putative [Medicago truncatula]
MAYNGGAVVLGVLAYATASISIQYPHVRRARAYYEQVFALEHVATFIFYPMNKTTFIIKHNKLNSLF